MSAPKAAIMRIARELAIDVVEESGPRYLGEIFTILEFDSPSGLEIEMNDGTGSARCFVGAAVFDPVPPEDIAGFTEAVLTSVNCRIEKGLFFAPVLVVDLGYSTYRSAVSRHLNAWESGLPVIRRLL
jgi:hypothetical protein